MKNEVPVIAACDVLIAESSLAGCALALGLARSGRKVMLASTSSSLGQEIAVCLRPWISEAELAAVPGDFKPWLRSCGKADGSLDLIRFTEGLEDMLLDAGVRLHYEAHPAGVLRAGRRLAGLVFAGKASLSGVSAAQVVDASPHATAARLAGASFLPRLADPRRRLACYSMQCHGEGPWPAGGEPLFHGPYAEFRLRLGIDPAEPFYASKMSVAARLAAVEAARALRASGAFPEKSKFSRGGDALHLEPLRRLDPSAPAPENLRVLGTAGSMGEGQAQELFQSPWGGLALGLGAAEGLKPAKAAAGALKAEFGMPGLPGARLGFRFGDAAGPIFHLERGAAAAKPEAPLAGSCQVLVVGGGTAGFPAAMTAAREGADTILVEKHSDLGGTRTIGGVADYWFGRVTDYVRGIDKANTLKAEAAMPMGMHYLSLAHAAGARVLLGCQAAGVLKQGSRLAGVVFAGPDGLEALRAERVIDATGDGDLAAWAGADYGWGTERDAMTMWFSFGKFKGARASASRQYDAVVDLRDGTDLTRAMISARRRVGVFGVGDTPQFYLAPRESRHIRGRARVSYAGILKGESFKDLAFVCRSNFDIKGIASSDLVLSGYVERHYTRNYDAPIPYAAMLPRKLENILVIGKAYDISHDALSLARMERDMMAMGGAAGLAASLSLKERRPLSRLPIPKYQKRLARLGVLKPGDLKASWRPKTALARQVALLEEGRAESDRDLCYLGDPAGLPGVLKKLRALCADGLPPGPREHHRPPDHGWSPEPCYWIAAASRVRDKRLVPVLEELAAKVKVDPKVADSSYDYVFAIAYACERLAFPECLPLLRRLASLPGLRGRTLPFSHDFRLSVDYVAERHAYLELCLGRAMARCGTRQGYEILIRYLGDQRGVLVRSARQELAALAGKDLGARPGPWKAWLRKAKKLPLKPYTKSID